MTQEMESTDPERKIRKPFAFRIINKLLVVGVIAIGGLFAISMSASQPTHLGVRNGSLADCPDSPNCVSSSASDEGHRMEPIRLSSSDQALIDIKSVIAKSFPRAKLITELDNYLHYEFTSLLFRFVDDVEFFQDEDGVIQFRSASRVGHSDMGANRKRMNKIIKRLEK